MPKNYSKPKEAKKPIVKNKETMGKYSKKLTKKNNLKKK